MFVKMYQSMYDGTLARRGPWEALVTFQQLLLLCDHKGRVDMHPDIISRRTLIPIEIIEKGIEHLGKPDPESRRKDADGRRIVPLDPGRSWGWQIVNYSHYRELRDTDERREYMREHMREKRAREKRARNAPERPPSDFDRFWAAYPRKQGKGAAERAWVKLNGIDTAAIFDGLAKTKWSSDPQFIPMPATWLNQKRWLDEQPDLGRCQFCGSAATAIFRGVPHCDVPRHIDQARDYARNSR